MKRALLISALSLAVMAAGCSAGLSRQMEYRLGSHDATVQIGDRTFWVYFHRTDNTVLVMRSFAGRLVSIGPEMQPELRAAAAAPLAELGCVVGDLYPVSRGERYEALFACPPEVNVAAAVASNRARWQAGISAPDPRRNPQAHED